ncbi:MAG: TIGR03435 family protein [Elusimicrobia bacterium]|nr:TIGR03435 family protein [Elusimicrobiota bacterium]
MIGVVLTPTEIRGLPHEDLSRSVCVILDILRATSSMVTALAHGAAKIVPADSVEHAQQMAASLPGCLLAGERNRVRIPGFHLANSPPDFASPAVHRRTIIMATTNGTRAIHACRKAKAVYIASFLNISATARAVAVNLRQPGTGLSIVCAGTEAFFAWEDCLAAGCLVELVRKSLPSAEVSDAAMAVSAAYHLNRRGLTRSLKAGSNGRTLLKLGLGPDIDWCGRVDAFGVVGRLRVRQGLAAVVRTALALVLAAGLVSGCGKAPEVGGAKPAPQIKLKLLQAPQPGLDGWRSLAGKAVVIEFWATWCESCVEDIPHLNSLADRFRGRPVQFLSVTDEPEAVVVKFLKTHEMRGWVGLDPSGEALSAFGVRGRPRTVFLDQAGNVAGETFPTLLTPEMIEAVLKGKPSKLSPSESKTQGTGKALASASISLSSGSQPESSTGPGLREGRGMPLLNVLEDAFDVDPARIALGPGLEEDATYDYSVSVPLEAEADLPSFFQQAVRAGLGVKTKRETRPTDVLVLSGRPAPGRKLLLPARFKTSMEFRFGEGRVSGSGVEMTHVIKVLQSDAGKIIVDETGLEGRFDLSLTWAPPDDPGALAKAVREQWGLSLAPGRRPVRFLKVEKRY